MSSPRAAKIWSLSSGVARVRAHRVDAHVPRHERRQDPDHDQVRAVRAGALVGAVQARPHRLLELAEAAGGDLSRRDVDLDVELAHLGLEGRVGDQFEHARRSRFAGSPRSSTRLSSISMPVIGRVEVELRLAPASGASTSRQLRCLSRNRRRSSRVKTTCSTSRPIWSLLRRSLPDGHMLGEIAFGVQRYGAMRRRPRRVVHSAQRRSALRRRRAPCEDERWRFQPGPPSPARPHDRVDDQRAVTQLGVVVAGAGTSM